ncbi:MAG: hypothetical protein PHG06_04060 [Parabacteroides sp.]|nr:hypothetical protein [Parabacteroides sp.]
MKKIWMILFLLPMAMHMIGQQKTEYNNKGDDAMKRLDYRDARMWFEEGVVQCDLYSIDQLTTIWLSDEEMRPSMRSLMNKCLNCLNVKGAEGDTIAVSKLILYYTEGIGTPKNEDLTQYWQKRLDSFRQTTIDSSVAKEQNHVRKLDKPKESIHFFGGYAFSKEAPYGLTVGIIQGDWGWFVRFRSNLSFKKFDGKCRDVGIIEEKLPDDPIFRFTNEKKVNFSSAIAGVVIRCLPWMYTSVGLGYGSRDLLCQYNIIDPDNYTLQKSYWCKNEDFSYQGLAADLDVMIKFGSVFISGGCSTVNFKYADLNAGIGLFF